MKKTVFQNACFKGFCMVLILFFTACEKDVIEGQDVLQSKTGSQVISANQLLSELGNPAIKNYIRTELHNEIGFAGLRTGDAYFNFLKIIKGNEYVTYSLLLNEYSETQPYHKYFIITKQGNVEKAGFVKYIPETATSALNMEAFTGKIELIDMMGDLSASTLFVNGMPQNQTQDITCTNSITVVMHTCSHGGNHSPGESCSEGYTNDGYWEIIITTICTGNTINYIAPPSVFMGNSGGGSMTMNLNVLAFLNGLPPEQLQVVQDYPELVTYLEEQDASETSRNFVLQLIGLTLDNGLELDFDNNSTDNQNFTNLDVFVNYVSEMSTDTDDDGEGTVIQLDQNLKFAQKTVALSPIIDLTVEVVSRPLPTFALHSSGCTSYISNVVVGNTWVQTSMGISNINPDSQFAEVTLMGYNVVDVSFEGLQFGIKQRKKVKFKINKITGQICCFDINTIR